MKCKTILKDLEGCHEITLSDSFEMPILWPATCQTCSYLTNRDLGKVPIVNNPGRGGGGGPPMARPAKVEAGVVAQPRGGQAVEAVDLVEGRQLLVALDATVLEAGQGLFGADVHDEVRLGADLQKGGSRFEFGAHLCKN